MPPPALARMLHSAVEALEPGSDLRRALGSRVLAALGRTRFCRFVVLSRSRTGSTLLVAFLNSHPNIRTDGEIFRRLRGRDHREVLGRVFGRQPWSVKARGFKLFYYHPLDGGDALWRDLAAMRDLHVIHLRRRNILRTLVSREIAAAQKVWRQTQPGATASGDKTVAFAAGELVRRFLETRAMERRGEEAFRGHPILPVDYEDLVADPAGTFRAVTAFLGVPARAPRAGLVKQNTEPLQQLVKNYDELKRAFAGTEWEAFFSE